MKIIVPVKAKSRRVPDKNFRPFHGGKSLFEILMDKLARLHGVRIFVSIDDPAVDFWLPKNAEVVPREPEQCEPGVSFCSEIFPELAGRVADPLEPVMCAYCTDPLFDQFGEFIAAWKQHCDLGSPGMVVGHPIPGYPAINVGRGVASVEEQYYGFSRRRHHPSEAIAGRYYSVGHTASICPAGVAADVGYLFPGNSRVFPAASPPANIDTFDDWERAQKLYAAFHGAD